MDTHRRSVLAGLAAASALGAIATPSRAASVRLKCGVVTPDDHPLTRALREAAAAVRRRSNDALEVEVFANGQLGSDADMLTQLRSGALEMFAQSASNLATLVPRASIVNVGFAWSGYDKVWPAVDGALGEQVKAEIGKVGLFAFDRMWDNGFREVTTSVRPVATPDDLAGLKLRVPNGALFTSLFKTLGAAPVAMNFSEAYSAMQTKVVDGQENPLPIIKSFKLAEVQKYLSLTNHIWDGFWLMSGRRTWDRLGADERTVLQEEFNRVALIQRRESEELGTSLRADLAAAGFTVNGTSPDPFRAKLRTGGFYAEWKGRFGADAWATLEKYAGEVS